LSTLQIQTIFNSIPRLEPSYITQAEPKQKAKIFAFSQAQEVRHVEFKNENETCLSLQVSPGPYIIVPTTFNPGKTGNFQLRIISDVPLPLTSLQDPVILKVDGTWKGNKAGGSLNDPEEWLKNTQYKVQVQQKTKLIINLEQNLVGGKAFGIGWSIMVSASRVSDPSDANIIHRSNYRPNKKVSETVDLEPGAYILVPTTFGAGEQTDFQLSLTCTDPQFSSWVSIQAI